MGPFIGFLVLLGPLVFVVLWLPLCLWIARKVAKRFTGGRARWASGAATFFVVLLLPFADSIAGRIYFNHLCSTEAGVKVYRTVELPAEYWDWQGNPKFYKENGDLDHGKLGNRFAEPHVIEPYPTFFRVDRMRMQLVENYSHDVLGEVIDFMYWGGWASRNLSPHNTAVGCEYFNGNKFWHDFYVRFFKPATSTR